MSESLSITVQVPWGRVADTMVGVVETPIGDFISSFYAAPDDLSQTLKRANDLCDSDEPARVIWYSRESYWRGGGKAEIRYENPNAGPDTLTKIIGPEEIISGLTVMAEKYPGHFADLMSEDGDAITDDCFIQCVLYGEAVYG